MKVFNKQPDELLHSFLLRRLAIHGAAPLNAPSLDKIITVSGYWSGLPKIPSSQTHLFKDLSWAEKVKASLQTKVSLDLAFSPNPLHYSWLAAKIFTGTSLRHPYHHPNILHHPISFCAACFKHQLSNYGFTWFRQNWIGQTKCNKHNAPLKSIVCQSCTEMTPFYRKAFSALSGKCNSCGALLWNDSSINKFSKQNRKLLKEVANRPKVNEVPKYLPCYIWAIINYVAPRLFELYFRKNLTPQHPISKAVKYYYSFIHYNGSNDTVSILKAYQFCELLHYLKDESINKLLNKICKIQEVRDVYCPDKDTYFSCKAYNMRNCDKCEVSSYDCPMSKLNRKNKLPMFGKKFPKLCKN